MVAHFPIMIGLWNLGMAIKPVHTDTQLNSSRLAGFSPLTGFEFSHISKYRNETSNIDIDAHFKHVPNVEIYVYVNYKFLNIIPTFKIFLNF